MRRDARMRGVARVTGSRVDAMPAVFGLQSLRHPDLRHRRQRFPVIDANDHDSIGVDGTGVGAGGADMAHWARASHVRDRLWLINVLNQHMLSDRVEAGRVRLHNRFGWIYVCPRT